MPPWASVSCTPASTPAWPSTPCDPALSAPAHSAPAAKLRSPGRFRRGEEHWGWAWDCDWECPVARSPTGEGAPTSLSPMARLLNFPIHFSRACWSLVASLVAWLRPQPEASLPASVAAQLTGATAGGGEREGAVRVELGRTDAPIGADASVKLGTRLAVSTSGESEAASVSATPAVSAASRPSAAPPPSDASALRCSDPASEKSARADTLVDVTLTSPMSVPSTRIALSTCGEAPGPGAASASAPTAASEATPASPPSPEHIAIRFSVPPTPSTRGSVTEQSGGTDVRVKVAVEVNVSPLPPVPSLVMADRTMEKTSKPEAMFTTAPVAVCVSAPATYPASTTSALGSSGLPPSCTPGPTPSSPAPQEEQPVGPSPSVAIEATGTAESLVYREQLRNRFSSILAEGAAYTRPGSPARSPEEKATLPESGREEVEGGRPSESGPSPGGRPKGTSTLSATTSSPPLPALGRSDLSASPASNPSALSSSQPVSRPTSQLSAERPSPIDRKKAGRQSPHSKRKVAESTRRLSRISSPPSSPASPSTTPRRRTPS
ncbi:hypothetical protein BDK51DRAFT_49107, partial [Blyttiomyces helicus]